MKRFVGSLVVSLLLGGCSETPLGYLYGSGPASRAIAHLGWGLIVISVVVCLLVLGLLLFAMFRRRGPEAGGLGGHDDRAALRWIGAGTGISIVFLFASALWTLWTVQNVTEASVRPALVIDVTGHQWWWEARYHADLPDAQFTTANDLVIPVGVPVQVNLRSDDVIHSFWVPRLAGKTDTIPGLTNVTRIQADQPGTYRGQCTEFCGMEHAQMAFFVVAKSQSDFNKWRDLQLQSVGVDLTDQGQQIFLRKCAACHTIRGLPAGGILGPNLSHFGSRKSIGAGILDNNARNLASWINNTQAIKPGSKMPQLDLPDDQVRRLTSFLEGLK